MFSANAGVGLERRADVRQRPQRQHRDGVRRRLDHGREERDGVLGDGVAAVRQAESLDRLERRTPLRRRRVVPHQRRGRPAADRHVAVVRQRQQAQGGPDASVAVGEPRPRDGDGLDREIGIVQEEQGRHPVVGDHVAVDDDGHGVLGRPGRRPAEHAEHAREHQG
jgi:hypothetical protein